MAEAESMTYDFTRDFSLEMPWKVGVYELSMELPLDYELHEVKNAFHEEDTTSGTLKMTEEELIWYHLRCNADYASEPRLVAEFMQTVMHSVGWLHQNLYNIFVLGFSQIREGDYKVPDLVEFVCGPMSWVVYNDHGNWPAIFRTDSLDKKNYLSYSRRGADVFVYDNKNGFIRQDY